MKLRKALAALMIAATITTTAVPAMASEGLVAATNAYGVEYQVDYIKGTAPRGSARDIPGCGWFLT